MTKQETKPREPQNQVNKKDETAKSANVKAEAPKLQKLTDREKLFLSAMKDGPVPIRLLKTIHNPASAAFGWKLMTKMYQYDMIHVEGNGFRRIVKLTDAGKLAIGLTTEKKND